ncbi:MAG: hypothetical protein O2983_10485, partial [Planctomycetota bacterium]|nr:hypothetical protein [Planctomycetota bacterium]
MLTTFIVDNAADVSDGDFSAGNFTLREAIEQANLNSGADDIVFSGDFGLVNPITLGGTQIVIADALTIDGTTAGEGFVNISGDDLSRIFQVSTSDTVTLTGLTLQNGASDIGGAILNDGADLMLSGVTIQNSNATISGGGIYNTSDGTVTATINLVNNTASGANSTDGGGGIFNDSGTVIIQSGSVI